MMVKLISKGNIITVSHKDYKKYLYNTTLLKKASEQQNNSVQFFHVNTK